MAYRTYTLPVLTASGTPSGSAAGTVTSFEPIVGEIKAIYFGYSGTATTTDVAVVRAATGGTILSVANSVTSGWFYPSVALNDGTAGARTAYSGVPVVEYLRATLAQGSAGDTLSTTVIVEF